MRPNIRQRIRAKSEILFPQLLASCPTIAASRDDLFVAGLIQPDSGLWGLVDYQAQLIAAYLQGLDANAPAARRFQRRKRGERPRLNHGIGYINSPRHLLEVEHFAYRKRLQRELRKMK